MVGTFTFTLNPEEPGDSFYIKYKSQYQKTFTIEILTEQFSGFNFFTSPKGKTQVEVRTGRGAIDPKFRFPKDKILKGTWYPDSLCSPSFSLLGYNSCGVSIIQNTNNLHPILAKEIIKEFLTVLLLPDVRRPDQLEERKTDEKVKKKEKEKGEIVEELRVLIMAFTRAISSTSWSSYFKVWRDDKIGSTDFD